MSVSPIWPEAGTSDPTVASRRRTSAVRLFGIVPLRWRGTVRGLIQEQERIGTKRSATTLTNHEAYVRSKGVAGGERLLSGSARRLEPVARKIDEINAEVIGLRKQLTQRDQTPVTGPYGEILTAIRAAKKQDELATLVQKETAQGSVRHTRVAPSELRRLRRLTWVDYPVLLFFFASFFNVDWQALGSLEREGLVGNLVHLMFAAVFAGLGTRFSAIGLATFGRFFRRFKDDQGHVSVPRGIAAVVPTVLTTLATGVVIGISTVMAYRIVDEAANAGVHGAGPALLGVTYAVLVALISFLLVVKNFQDGSELTDQIDHLTDRLAPVRQQQHDLRQQIDRLEAARAIQAGKAARMAAVYRSKASEPVQAADQVILLARGVHQGCGPEAAPAHLGEQPPYGLIPPTPEVDSSPLDTVMASIEASQEQLPTSTTSTPVVMVNDSVTDNTAVNGKSNDHQRTLRIIVGIDKTGDANRPES